jgi:hypothetical protein
MGIGRRPVESELGRLGAMISHESRAEDQLTLTILHGIAEVIMLQAEELKLRISEHKEILRAQQETLDEHSDIVLRGKTSWYWLSAIVGVIFMGVVGLFGYSYTMIADIRDKVRDQQTIEEYIKSNASSMNNTNSEVESHAQSIDQLQGQVEGIKKLKVIKAAK